jgi:hypothetical protein
MKNNSRRLMSKETVRVSFDVPVDEHILYKMECVKTRVPIKDFIHTLVIMGMKEYKKAKLNEKLSRSIQQAKKGKVRTISSEELDQWETDLENDV